jgi:kynurenine formamidase
MVRRGVRVLGVDTLSPDQTPLNAETATGTGYGVHEEMLGSGGVIVENLVHLDELVGEECTVSLVPMNVEGCDGARVEIKITITTTFSLCHTPT